MTPNATSSSAWRLYVVVDRAAAGSRDPVEIGAAAVRGGADAIQLRGKSATTRQLLDDAIRLLRVTRPAGVPLIINDRADVARASGADGVHVGQDDLPVAAARALLGPGRLVGKSTHSLEQAIAAETEGADYIGVGPLFATPTKPDYPSVGLALIGQVRGRVRVPTVCIGGIEPSNLEAVRRSGARCVAVVRAVCAAADPEAATRALKQGIMRVSSTPRSAARV